MWPFEIQFFVQYSDDLWKENKKFKFWKVLPFKHLNAKQLFVKYSDDTGFQMFCIQILTLADAQMYEWKGSLMDALTSKHLVRGKVKI